MLFIQMVSGRIRFKKIDSLEREDGKAKGSWWACPLDDTVGAAETWKHLLSLHEGNYCFARCDCLGLATCVICRPQEWGGGTGKGLCNAWEEDRGSSSHPLGQGACSPYSVIQSPQLPRISSSPASSPLTDLRIPVDPMHSQPCASGPLLMLGLGLEG